MSFQGKREIYITDEVSPFFAKAAKLIFNDLGIDFERAVIDYADEECIDLNIDGEEKTLYYEMDGAGFSYKLVDTDDYDDLTTDYAGYDEEGDDEDPFSLRDDDEDGMFDDMEDDFDDPYFQIAFSVILTALDINPEEQEIELLYYDEEEIGLVFDGKDAVIHIDLESEHPFVLEWLNGSEGDEEEDGDEPDDGPLPDNVIPFSNYSLF